MTFTFMYCCVDATPLLIAATLMPHLCAPQEQVESNFDSMERWMSSQVRGHPLLIENTKHFVGGTGPFLGSGREFVLCGRGADYFKRWE